MFIQSPFNFFQGSLPSKCCLRAVSPYGPLNYIHIQSGTVQLNKAWKKNWDGTQPLTLVKSSGGQWRTTWQKKTKCRRKGCGVGWIRGESTEHHSNIVLCWLSPVAKKEFKKKHTKETYMSCWNVHNDSTSQLSSFYSWKKVHSLAQEVKNFIFWQLYTADGSPWFQPPVVTVFNWSYNFLWRPGRRSYYNL